MRREQAVLLRLVLVAVVEPREELAERGRLRSQPSAAVPRRGDRRRVRRRGRRRSRARCRRPRCRQMERNARSIGCRACADLHRRVLPQRVDRVLAGDVADLVAEHAGQLRLVLDKAEGAARDVHEPARRRERVHAVGVQHDEGPRQVGSLRRFRQRHPDERHVLVNRRILDDAEPLAHLRADIARR